MTDFNQNGLKLGINGFGRIGKLTVWHHVARKVFDEIVVNIGRTAGTSIEDIGHYVERDSTYGWLHGYLYGHSGQPVVSDLDEDSGSMMIDGVRVRFLRAERKPVNINWRDQGVRLVVETTGQFLDPTLEPEHSGGALRGHL
jgi:glyceraldehyde 3-phosphate dehydrogenase